MEVAYSTEQRWVHALMQLTRSTPGTSTKHDFWQLVRQLAARASETRERLYEEDQFCTIASELGRRWALGLDYCIRERRVTCKLNRSSSLDDTHPLTLPCRPIVSLNLIQSHEHAQLRWGGTTRQGSLDSHDGRGSDLHRWCLRVRTEDKRTSNKLSGKHYEVRPAP